MQANGKLDPKDVQLHPAGHISQEWQVRLPAGVSFGDIFSPSLWVDIEKIMRPRGAKRPRKEDLLRIIGHDFDVLCLVVAVDAGYHLAFYAGKRPPPMVQVLGDLDALPNTGTSAEVKERARLLTKRWQAAGISREHVSSARRTYAKTNHPDAGAVDGRRLALANAVIDAALARFEEAA